MENRLILKETTFVGSNISKIASKFQHFIKSKAISAMNTASELEIKDLEMCLESLCREVEQYSIDMKKVAAMQVICSLQIHDYYMIAKQTENEIDETENNIIDLDQIFNNEKLIRSHRERVEALANQFNQLPCRSHSKRKLDALEESIAITEDNLQAIRGRIACRFNQFASVLQQLSDLQLKLVQEVDLGEIDEMNIAQDECDDDDLGDRDGGDRDEPKSPTQDEGGLLTHLHFYLRKSFSYHTFDEEGSDVDEVVKKLAAEGEDFVREGLQQL